MSMFLWLMSVICIGFVVTSLIRRQFEKMKNKNTKLDQHEFVCGFRTMLDTGASITNICKSKQLSFNAHLSTDGLDVYADKSLSNVLIHVDDNDNNNAMLSYISQKSPISQRHLSTLYHIKSQSALGAFVIIAGGAEAQKMFSQVRDKGILDLYVCSHQHIRSQMLCHGSV